MNDFPSTGNLDRGYEFEPLGDRGEEWNIMNAI